MIAPRAPPPLVRSTSPHVESNVTSRTVYGSIAMGSIEVPYRFGRHTANSARGSLRTVAVSILVALLAGCAAGPDFKQPAAPAVTSYTATPVPAQTTSAPIALGNVQRIDVGASVSSQWWHSLGSPRLDALVEQALEASPTLASARATLRQAQEIHAARAGSTLYPRVDALAAVQRQRTPAGASGQGGAARQFDLYSATLGVRYELDLAGGNRRALEALAARADYQRYQVQAAGLTLAGNVVATAIVQASLAGQIEATEAIVLAQQEQLRILATRVHLGHAAADEVLALETQVEQTRAGLPLLRKQLEQSRHLLAILVGDAPATSVAPAFALEEFTLPSELPLVVPSELVRRRPDIQAAEALLRAANAEYGAAVAKLYPRIDLSASLGSQALTTGALFGAGSALWSLVGQLTQPLFDPGLPAEKRAALAAFDAAAANYRRVVLEALRDVADALRAVEHDAHALAALAAADAAAQGSLTSVQRQYTLGVASYVQLLIAQQQAQQARIGRIAAQAQRLLDSAAVFQAMGAVVVATGSDENALAVSGIPSGGQSGTQLGAPVRRLTDPRMPAPRAEAGR